VSDPDPVVRDPGDWERLVAHAIRDLLERVRKLEQRLADRHG
jgi:hypothetical protein